MTTIVIHEGTREVDRFEVISQPVHETKSHGERLEAMKAGVRKARENAEHAFTEATRVYVDGVVAPRYLMGQTLFGRQEEI